MQLHRFRNLKIRYARIEDEDIPKSKVVFDVRGSAGREIDKKEKI
jgi:hypothetical protein